MAAKRQKVTYCFNLSCKKLGIHGITLTSLQRIFSDVAVSEGWTKLTGSLRRPAAFQLVGSDEVVNPYDRLRGHQLLFSSLSYPYSWLALAMTLPKGSKNVKQKLQ